MQHDGDQRVGRRETVFDQHLALQQGVILEVGGDAGPAIITEDRWKEILKVNYTVNSTIQQMKDEQIYGVEERWAYPSTVGDCE
ncbi:transglutaminase-like cysteine peptidase, partial [Rhizobium leguminosarum]